MNGELLELIERVLQENGVPENLIPKIQIRICAEAGGARHYVPRFPSAIKQQIIGEALAKGKSIKEAFDEAGVKKVRGYALLKKPYKIRL